MGLLVKKKKGVCLKIPILVRCIDIVMQFVIVFIVHFTVMDEFDMFVCLSLLTELVGYSIAAVLSICEYM